MCERARKYLHNSKWACKCSYPPLPSHWTSNKNRTIHKYKLHQRLQVLHVWFTLMQEALKASTQLKRWNYVNIFQLEAHRLHNLKKKKMLKQTSACVTRPQPGLLFPTSHFHEAELMKKFKNHCKCSVLAEFKNSKGTGGGNICYWAAKIHLLSFRIPQLSLLACS